MIGLWSIMRCLHGAPIYAQQALVDDAAKVSFPPMLTKVIENADAGFRAQADFD